MLDFSFAKSAKLTQSELAAVLGVSRVTVNMWIKGKAKPHRLHAGDIRKRLNALREAIESGKLPSSKVERSAALIAVVANSSNT